MANNNVKALKSSIWYIAANFLTSASAFLTTPIFTRLLSKEEYGMYNNFTSWQSILAILLTFNVGVSLISARYDYEDNLNQFICSALALSTVPVLLAAVLLNCFSHWAQKFFSLSRIHLNWMLAHILFLRVYELFQRKQQFFFKYRLQAALSILSTLASAGLSLLLVTQMEDRLTGRIIGSVLPDTVIGFCLYIYFFYKGRRIQFEHWKYLLRICLPYIPHLLSMTILGSTDRIMITRMCGSSDTALYSLAYNCGTIMGILMNSLNMAFSPWLADRIHENDTKSVRIFSKSYILSFVCVSLGIMMIAPEILYILGGQSYLPAMYVMPPVVMSCICQFLYTMMVNVEQIKGKTVGMAFASVVAALTNYVLNLLFIPRFGYIAAAYTTLVGYLLLLVLHMWMVHRMGMSQVYNYQFIAGTVLTVGMITISMNAVYKLPLVRYVFIAGYVIVLVAFLYWKRDLLWGAIQAVKGDKE